MRDGGFFGLSSFSSFLAAVAENSPVTDSLVSTPEVLREFPGRCGGGRGDWRVVAGFSHLQATPK